MSSRREDRFKDEPLLDGCLDEVLGGRQPPDLTARILQAWAMRRQSSLELQSELNLAMPPLPGPPVETLPVEIAPPTPGASLPLPGPVLRKGGSAASRTSSARVRKQSAVWPWWVAAACVAGIGATLVIVANQPGPGAVVVKPNTRPNEVVKIDDGKSGAERRSSDATSNQVVTKPAPKQNVSGESGNMNQPPLMAQNNGVRDTGSGPSPGDPKSVPKSILKSPRRLPAAIDLHQLVDDKRNQAISDTEMVSYINASLAAAWKENNVQPSVAASDEEWCRRVFLRMLGRIPTVDELKKFATDKSRDKREKLVTRLTEDDSYAEQFAAHWAGVWSNLLIGRTMTRDAEKIASREGLEHYLRQSLAAKKPYYQIVYELLTAEGTAQPGSKEYNGAVNFLVASLGQNATLATARTSRVFLGQQLQCAQCHQHPTNEWNQQQYWALNAFFRQARIEQVAGVTKLTNDNFVSLPNVTTEGEVYYELPNGTVKATGPQFVDGTKIPASGRLDDVDRRQELAKLVIKSPQFGPALVNRLWSHYFGFGFTRPVDDIGPNNAPTNPELLAKISEQFVAHDYDIRKVMKWVVLSDAFGRSSRITPNNIADAPEAGSTPLFTHYYTRQMQAEEVYNSLLIAADLRKKSSNQRELETARIDWLAQFNRPMGTDDSEEESHFNGSMRQSLIMMNGDLMRRAVNSDDGSLLKHVLQSNLKPEEKVEHLFLAALSRQPTKRELDAVKQLIAQHKGDASGALEDIWWALLNSNEFILDH